LSVQLETKSVLISGIAAGIVILVLSMIVSTITQALFNYDVLALAGMRSINDPVGMLFLYPFVVALPIAVLYGFTKRSFTGTAMRKGIVLGLFGWIVYGIPSAFIVFSSMDYPLGFTANSVIGSLIYMLGAGITITSLSK